MTQKHFQLDHVEALPGHQLAMHFADGESMTVDLRQTIEKHPSLAHLQADAIFQQAALDEWRLGVTWAGDDNLTLASDNLRAMAIEQAGECSHQRVVEWMAQHHLTLDTAAEALGLSRRMLAYYRSGEKPVPRTVALAMLGWEVEHEYQHAA